jgi:hypothetical protein
MIMKAYKKITRTLVVVVSTFGIFQLQQSTSAQSTRGFSGLRGSPAQPATTQSARSNCKKISGNSFQVFDPVTGVVSGPVTNAGFLDGTLEDVINFDAGFAITPDPNVFTYTTALTITTSQGQLKLNPVTTQSIVTGSGNEFGEINSDASTGRFAGGKGTFWLTFKPVGDPSIGPYEAELTTEICFAQ